MDNVLSEIGSLRDTFYRAHCGTSFSPEKRAASCVDDFSVELIADLEKLGDRAGNYKEKYINYLKQWAARKSRCMSSMITGPANFPVASNRKKIDSEIRMWEEFRAWRDRYFKKAFAEPILSPEEEIPAAEAELEKQKRFHQQMIDVNKIFRSAKTPEQARQMLADKCKFSAGTIDKLMEPKRFGRHNGFETFELSLSNAKIKRLKEKVATMKARITIKETFEKIIFPGGSIDIENDRVVIYHESKPEQSIIDALKHNGFRWSPRFKCWCRKHTGNAIHAAKRVCGVA